MKKLKFMNNDIGTEVLSRLSTRDLQVMKFVSKEWQSLVSDRSLIRSHLEKKETVSGFFFQEKYEWLVEDVTRLSYIPIEAKNTSVFKDVLSFLPEGVVILDSCNGLLCCRSSFPSSDPKLYVCNPLSKEWISLKWTGPAKETSFSFVFEKSSSQLDDDPLDFKVVAVWDAESEDSELLFDIYSSSSKNWRRSTEICHCTESLISKKGVSVGGSLYWLTDGDQIVMFDSKRELSCLIPLPLPASELQVSTIRCIGESQGKLHYVQLSEYGLQLWVLKEPFSFVWDPKVAVPLDELAKNIPESLNSLAALFTTEATTDMALCFDLFAFKDDILFIRVTTYICVYNFQTGKMKRLCLVSDLGPLAYNSPIVVPYTMSLVPLASD